MKSFIIDGFDVCAIFSEKYVWVDCYRVGLMANIDLRYFSHEAPSV